jgi:hypothetical protein
MQGLCSRLTRTISLYNGNAATETTATQQAALLLAMTKEGVQVQVQRNTRAL